MTPEVAVDTCKVRGLLGAVRDKVLIWALDLAEAGIHGEGMTFTAQERQQAQQFAPVAHIHIGGNFNGGQLMVSSPGGQQQQTLTGEQKEAALAALLPWLAQVIAQGQLQREACAELQAELDTLKAQAASPNPKWPVIGAVAGSVRTILEGAGGGMLAAQALGWLASHLDRQLINIVVMSGAAASRPTAKAGAKTGHREGLDVPLAALQSERATSGTMEAPFSLRITRCPPLSLN